MFREEQDRLKRTYLNTVSTITKAGSHIPDSNSEAWREATRETPRASKQALLTLNRHRKDC
jgi:hypothetical protein